MDNSMPMSEKPLVSMILLSYRLESYIRQSVVSALSQTYSPLEIIISDDCSPDSTYQIILDEVGKYSGPHQVKVVKTPANMGICGNTNFAFKLSHGELIVRQDGDDISEPDRVEKMVGQWLKCGRPGVVVHNVRMIDDQSRILAKPWWGGLYFPDNVDLAVERGFCTTLGCSSAYHRDIFERFGPLPLLAYQDDNMLSFRALLTRGITSLPEHLLHYRWHSDNMYLGKLKLHRQLDTARRWAVNRKAVVNDWRRCLKLCGYPDEKGLLKKQLRKWALLAELEIRCCDLPRSKAVAAVLSGFFRGLPPRKTFRLLRNQILRQEKA